MPNYIFSTPYVNEGPSGGHRLFYFATLRKGVTIIKNGGTYQRVRYPAEDDLRTYSEVYMGGTKNIVNDATKAALIAGGIGVTEANFTAI
ncbi:MAG: hypothetical protein EB103_02825 [Actinobacteria bacterium]|nr:hypothetical protein [Actinomycetota bacterium]